MVAPKLVTMLVLALWPLGNGMAAGVDEAPEVIVVTGRMPGPPLWRVSKGENVLWIFPHLEWIPKGMVWDSGRVERVIEQSQETLSLPVINVSYPSASERSLNPFNTMRNRRLLKRLNYYPDGGTLEENLPPELYARYATVQARYFPGERDYAYMRPWAVSEKMMQIVRKEEGLVFGGDILSTIGHLVRRNRDIKRTEISVEMKVDGSYRDYAEHVEALEESSPELEYACFEQQVHLMEEIEETRRHANSWAEGDIDEFQNNDMYDISLLGQLPACEERNSSGSSPERESRALVYANLNQTWLDAAENALATNASTFAVLPINELVAEDGLLSKLKAKGYEVREP